MKKLQNDALQMTGIVLSLIGLATVLQPLIRLLFGKALIYRFPGVENGWISFSVWAIVLLIGLVLVSITKPLNKNDKHKG